MLSLDLVRLSFGALEGRRLRTALSMLGVGIGVAAVILLTSIGEGARRYVVGAFTQFGTNILQVTPGKTETFGIPGAFGGTTHKLTIDDALALRSIPGVLEVMPQVLGQARVEAGGLGRSVYVVGVTSAVPAVWKMNVRRGRFLPAGDPRRGAPLAVLGPTVARELFGTRSPMGQFVRVAGSRLRVIGVMESKGQLLGFDMDDMTYVPVATAMRMFDLDELIEIDLTFSHEGMTERVTADVRRMLTERHGGEEDFTILTQKGMLDVFGKVMSVITLAVGGIGAISLVVGAIGILTMMWIAVGERTREIGLLRSIGATAGDVQRLFLLEAVGLAGTGGVLGLVAGLGAAAVLRLLVPGLPTHTPPLYIALALVVSLLTGVVAGVAPARRAAALDPVEALHAE